MTTPQLRAIIVLQLLWGLSPNVGQGQDQLRNPRSTFDAGSGGFESEPGPATLCHRTEGCDNKPLCDFAPSCARSVTCCRESSHALCCCRNRCCETHSNAGLRVLRQIHSRIQNPTPWFPVTEFQFKPGKDRILGDGRVMLPLWQQDQSLFFADLRCQTDDLGNFEGNWGLGLRTIIDDHWIAGGYAFYDRRWTDHSNTFDQLAFGIEALAVGWEARINGYLPETAVKPIASPPGNALLPRAEFDGTTIQVVTQGGSRRFETAYSGLDAELGYLLAGWGENNDVELRGFLGGFYFDTDEPGLPNISGPRARAELRMYDLDILGVGSRITFGADYQWDQVRDDQFFAVLRVQIPLMFGRKRQRLNPLQRRMMDRIVRDVDVVVNMGERSPPELREPALYDDTGLPVGQVSVVDANTPDVPLAVQNAGSGSTVIVDGSHGQIDTIASIDVQTNQTLRGAGFRVRGIVSGATADFGTRPTIRGTNPTSDVVIVGSDSIVRDLDIVGGRNGVATGNDGSDPLTAGTTILNNRVSGVGESGFRFGQVDGILLDNSSISNGIHGFALGHIDGTLSNNTATGNAVDGFSFTDLNGTLSDNSASGNGEDGYDFRDLNVGALFSNNFAASNSATGVVFRDLFGSLTSNTATGNGDDGFGFRDLSAGGLFSNNIAASNLGDGVVFRDVFGLLTSSTAMGSGDDGFDFRDLTVGGAFSNNVSNDNGDLGYDNRNTTGTAVNNTGANNANGNNTFP